MSTNTNYGIRPVTQAEIVATFGSRRHARNTAGKDEALLLFYIHNPDKVPPDAIKQAVLAAWESATRRGPKDRVNVPATTQRYAFLLTGAAEAAAQKAGDAIVRSIRPAAR